MKRYNEAFDIVLDKHFKRFLQENPTYKDKGGIVEKRFAFTTNDTVEAHVRTNFGAPMGSIMFTFPVDELYEAMKEKSRCNLKEFFRSLI